MSLACWPSSRNRSTTGAYPRGCRPASRRRPAQRETPLLLGVLGRQRVQLRHDLSTGSSSAEARATRSSARRPPAAGPRWRRGCPPGSRRRRTRAARPAASAGSTGPPAGHSSALLGADAVPSSASGRGPRHRSSPRRTRRRPRRRRRPAGPSDRELAEGVVCSKPTASSRYSSSSARNRATTTKVVSASATSAERAGPLAAKPIDDDPACSRTLTGCACRWAEPTVGHRLGRERAGRDQRRTGRA